MFDVAIRRPFGALLRPRRAPRVNPNRWSFDPDTGEFYLVVFKCGEGALINVDTYHERLTKRLKLIRTAHKELTITAISALVLKYSWSYSATRRVLDHHRFVNMDCLEILAYYAILLSFSYGLCFGSAWLFHRAQLLFSAEYAAGPKPVPPPGLEEVERQKVHGVGGFASRDDIDRAARGFTDTSADHYTFDD